MNFMELALAEGEKGRYAAPPNPWVGCVIVKEGKVIGKGHTQPFGGAHAEVQAIRDAGQNARGATAFVTLEPCSHFGKTPPCAAALIEAGVKKVEIATLDPDPLVTGKGVRMLLEAGIEVGIGLLFEKVAQSFLPYFCHRKFHRPYIILKSAASLDGKTALSNGSSKWITCEEARKDVHCIRARSQAILIGSGTALADSPKLNVRLPEITASPLRILIDSKGKVPEQGPLFDPELGKTVVATTSNRIYKNAIRWKFSGEKVPLHELCKKMAEEGVLQVLVEGGSQLHHAFLAESLWDEWVLYFGPRLFGNDSFSLFPSNSPFEAVAQTPELTLDSVEKLGQSIKSRWRPKTGGLTPCTFQYLSQAALPEAQPACQ